MRALAWLNKLRRDRRGNVLAITAASLPLIIGGAAMAIDSIQLSVWKRQLQRAADSAAIAGVYADAQDADEEGAVHRDLSENIFPTLSQAEEVEVGPRLGWNRTVWVRLTAQRTVPFMSFFTNRSTTISAEATAALVDDGEFCLLSLYDGTDTGVNANGNANVDLSCGIATNSESEEESVTAGGSSSIRADPISAVGGIDGDENFVEPTTLMPHSTPVTDPFANRPLPAPTGCSDDTFTVENGETRTLNAGECYAAWDVKNGGILLLAEGNHFVNGGNISLHGEIHGQGPATIVMTGDTNNSDGDLIVGDFIQNGGGVLDIEASETGDYRGIALYRDPRANLLTVKINGGADTVIRGAIYMPGTDLWLGGNASFDAECLQVVARIITFRGGADIENRCEDGSASQALRRTIVRLVG